ncbi:MAG: Flp pilus assembly protein TadB [Rickettsiales bacterium]|jgi:Flp pilus assembly protein TadB
MDNIEKKDIKLSENLSKEEKLKGFIIFKGIPLAFFCIALFIGSVELFLALFVAYLLICSYLKNLYNKNSNKFPKYFEVLNEKNVRIQHIKPSNKDDYYERHYIRMGSSFYRR